MFFIGAMVHILHSMKCSIQPDLASFNRVFYLSPHENINTISLITIHYLYFSLYKLFADNLISLFSSDGCCLNNALNGIEFYTFYNLD